MTNFERIVQEHISRVPLSHNQQEAIRRGVQRYQQRTEHVYRALFGALSLGSLALLIYTGISVVRAMGQSGFGQYISLIFSDGGVVIAYWKELMWALAESIPVFSTVLWLSAIALFLWSITKTAKHAVYHQLKTR